MNTISLADLRGRDDGYGDENPESRDLILSWSPVGFRGWGNEGRDSRASPSVGGRLGGGEVQGGGSGYSD